MENETPATQAVAATGNETDRQQQLQQLYIRNFGFIKDTALSDRRLFVTDGERITEGVAKQLPEYDGPIQDESFRQWLTEVIQSAVSKLSRFYSVKEQCPTKMLYDAFWKVLRDAGLGEDETTIQHLTAELWFWLFRHLDEFLASPGTASISTRLCARARWIARGWKTARLRERTRFESLNADGELEATAKNKVPAKAVQPFLTCEGDKNASSERVSDTPVRIKQESIDMNIRRPSKMLCLECRELKEVVSIIESVELACGHKRPHILPTTRVSLERLSTEVGKRLFPMDKHAMKTAEPVPCI